MAADRVSQRPTLVPVSASPRTLIVPQVAGQAYVFAKGILQDGGFAWHLLGAVQGYAGNTVVDQSPAAGSVVLDTGAPTITLVLARNRAYAERGRPENNAPYAGTTVLLPGNVPAATTLPTPASQRAQRRPAGARPAQRHATAKKVAGKVQPRPA